MRKWMVKLERGLALLAIVLLLGVASSAKAFSPSSSVRALPEYSSERSFMVDYVADGGGGTISSIDLYLSKDFGPWVKAATSYPPLTPFRIDIASYGGDGNYAFHTVAHVTTGEEETGKTNAEETSVKVDTVAPPAPDFNHLFVNRNASQNENEITGHSQAVEAHDYIDIYSDAALTRKITTTAADGNGAWGPVTIGSQRARPYVWVVARDFAGNKSVATMVQNRATYSETVSGLKVKQNGGDKLDLSYIAPVGAYEYVIYYRHAGGSVWSAKVVTPSTTPQLTGLDAGRAYDIRVAPVDNQNNVGRYWFVTARTAGTPIDNVVISKTGSSGVIGSVGGGTEVPVKKRVAATTSTSTKVAEETTTTTTPPATTPPATKPGETKPGETKPATETPSTTPKTETPAATTEEPAKEEAKSSSATPWVILAILIILAGVATGGYFYWFSGPEEVTTTVKPDQKDEDKDKRW